MKALFCLRCKCESFSFPQLPFVPDTSVVQLLPSKSPYSHLPPVNKQSGLFTKQTRPFSPLKPPPECFALPGRPSACLHCWRATAPGHGKPRSLNRRQTLGRLGWRTPAPATSQCDPLPSSVWNWIRNHIPVIMAIITIITASGLPLSSTPSLFVDCALLHLNPEENFAPVSTYFPHQKLLRLRCLLSIFINTESTSM